MIMVFKKKKKITADQALKTFVEKEFLRLLKLGIRLPISIT
jgi:hypothetical protein